MSDGVAGPLERGIGLCSLCAHARTQESARGSRFWRCARSDHDPAFRRYPPLPVRACAGFERAPDPREPADAPGKR